VDIIQMLESIIADISKMSLTGPYNWNCANSALNKLSALIEGEKKSKEAKERAEKAALEEARLNRERIKKIAESNGEEILGGETVRINADGTREVLIP